jgi:glycosyltransferase involved in cell wall biosynthesis
MSLLSTRIPESVRAKARSPKAITICHPVWRLDPGGLERQLLGAVSRLSPDLFRHVVIVRGLEPNERLPDALNTPNVVVVRDDSDAKSPAWSSRLVSWLSQHDVDAVHVRGLTMLLDVLTAARQIDGVSVALSFHGFEHPDISLPAHRRAVWRRAVLACDDRWAVSGSAALAIAAQLKISPHLFGVVPNGVDSARYSATADATTIRRRLGLPEIGTILLCVGNLKPIKGHEVLLEAILRLGPAARGVTWLFVGQDYRGGRLQEWTRTHLADLDVRFVGRQEDALAWYQAADAFVQPSHWDGMPNALLEAMSCGLPAIGSAVGGIAEAIDDGRTGLLVPPGDVTALSKVLERILADRPLRHRLGQAAAEEVRNRYGAESCRDLLSQRYVRLGRRIEEVIGA